MESNIINIKQSPTTEQPQTPLTTGEPCGNIEPATATENKGTTTNNSPQNIPSLPITASPSLSINTQQTTMPQNITMESQSPPNYNATLQQKSINDPNFNNPTDPDTDNPNNRELKTPLLFSAFTLPPHHLSYTNTNTNNTQPINSQAKDSCGEDLVSRNTPTPIQHQPQPPIGITKPRDRVNESLHQQQFLPSNTIPSIIRNQRQHSLRSPESIQQPSSTSLSGASDTDPKLVAGKLSNPNIRSGSRSRSRAPGLKVFIPPRPGNLPIPIAGVAGVAGNQDPENPTNPENAENQANPLNLINPQPVYSKTKGRDIDIPNSQQRVLSGVLHLPTKQQQHQRRNNLGIPITIPITTSISIQNQTSAEATETKEEKELRIKAIRNAQASYEAGRKDDAPETPGIYRLQRLVQFEQQIRVEKIRLERAAREASEAKEIEMVKEAGKEKDDGNAATAEEIEDHMRVIRDFADNEGAFPLKNIDELLNFGADTAWEVEEEAEVIVDEIARRSSGTN